MAKVFLLSVSPPDDIHGRLELDYLLQCAKQDRFQVHELTDDPNDADLIIYAERENAAGEALQGVRRHPIARKCRDKCFVFNPRYKGIPIVPGIYASISKRYYNERRVRSGHYPEVVENEFFRFDSAVEEQPYLYSFAGMTWTADVRRDLACIKHPRGLFLDTSDEGIELRKVSIPTGKEQRYIERYVDIIRRSKFVLCPRGTGPSSMRLFESMLLGRVPVIISDQWVPPEGPEWEKFSIRVNESDVGIIPYLLEEKEQYAHEMGLIARREWERWFSRESTFHNTIEGCLCIMRTRLWSEGIAQPVNGLRYLVPSRIYDIFRKYFVKPLYNGMLILRDRLNDRTAT